MKRFIDLTSIRGLMASAVFVLGSGAVLAADLKINLTGAQETPPVTTSASGTGTITVGADKSVSGTLTSSSTSKAGDSYRAMHEWPQAYSPRWVPVSLRRVSP
jgi:hypothetical protein